MHLMYGHMLIMYKKALGVARLGFAKSNVIVVFEAGLAIKSVLGLFCRVMLHAFIGWRANVSGTTM